MRVFTILILTAMLSGCSWLGDLGKKQEEPTQEVIRKESVEVPLDKPTYITKGITVDVEGIKSYFSDYSASIVSKNRFVICSGQSCQVKTKWRPDDEDLNSIKEEFRNVRDAESERVSIKKAIAKYETITGEIIGTSADKAGSTFMGNGDRKEMDFSDENINTLNYLMNLFENGLIRYHSISAPVWKTKMCFGNCSLLPVLTDIENNKFVINSDLDNGQEPIITEYSVWKKS